MREIIYGYKCFNSGLVNRYGFKFTEGMTYYANNMIKFSKNGFHMCENLEDTLRYFDAMNYPVDIAYVQGMGNKNSGEDNYYGYYDMYAVEVITIIHVLSREEIISYALRLNSLRLKRFISLFKLTMEEKELFRNKFPDDDIVLSAISYYQDRDLDVYKRKLLSKK